MIETEEIQGNVLYAYGPRFRHARYILLQVTNAERARKTLRELTAGVTFGQRPKGDDNARPSHPHLNIAFTHAGLKELGVSAAMLDAFPKEFRTPSFRREAADPAQAEAKAKAEADANDPWTFGRSGTGHVLLVVHSVDKPDPPASDPDSVVDPDPVTAVRQSTSGFAEVFDRHAALLERPRTNATDTTTKSRTEDKPNNKDGCNAHLAREHFGFADGCSQPAIEGVHDDPVGGGIYARRPFGWWKPLRWLELLTEDLGIRKVPRHWRGIRAGEFVLGYESEDGRVPPGPPAPLGPNGTFMVYSEIEQHVDAFEEYVKGRAKELEDGLEVLKKRREDLKEKPDPTAPSVEFEALIRAKIVGRWRDGTPLALSPDGEDTLIATNARRANNFLYNEDRDGYRADPEGLRCPLGAHVRRTNPRDALPGGAERTMRHRIIRRGMPYGKPYDEEPAAERGLAFVCFGSSIHNGFEFIQKEWCKGGDAFGLGKDRDLLLQQDDGTELTGMVIPGRGDTSIVLEAPAKPFVTVRGCEYLFLPSRSAYEWLTKPDR